MAVRRAGKKRKKAGTQAGLQTGILGGNTGEFAFSSQPETAMGSVFGRAGYGKGPAEYEQWFTDNATRDMTNRYGQALTVNKSLSYPEFLQQTYGATMQGPGRVVGAKGHKRRLPGSQFDPGRINEVADKYSREQFNEQTNPEAALAVGMDRLATDTNMSSGAAGFLRDQGDAARGKYLEYQQKYPWQDWSDFLNGITTAKPAGYDYDPTQYHYHAATAGGGGGGGKGRKKKGRR